MDIGEKIKAIRKEKRISQAEIAKLLNVTQATYSHLENRSSKLTYEQIEKIAEALGVSVKYLLFGEDEHLVKLTRNKDAELENKIKDLEKELEFLNMKMKKEEVLAEVYFNFFKNISKEEKNKAFNEMPKEIKAIFFTLIGVELIDWITKDNKDNNSVKGKISKKAPDIDKSELPDDLDDYEKK